MSNLTERLTNTSGNAANLYLDFAHDTTIDLILTALGLAEYVVRFAGAPTASMADQRVSNDRLFSVTLKVTSATPLRAPCHHLASGGRPTRYLLRRRWYGSDCLAGRRCASDCCSTSRPLI